MPSQLKKILGWKHKFSALQSTSEDKKAKRFIERKKKCLEVINNIPTLKIVFFRALSSKFV